ncbi:MAG: HAD family hydrolase [Cyanobacteria bacterium CRU_2_1]|nr:HAD family hydrolase [Cyanobacteria bacterium CRU_2_1]
MIFFDIDQTLINHQHAQDTAALLFLQRFSSLLPYASEEFCHYWQTVMKKHFATFMGGKITFVEHRRRRMRELFQEAKPGLANDEADELFAIYLKHYEDNWQLFDDVLPCLNALSNCRLGIISNGNTEQQTKKLYQTGIATRFDIVVVSEKVGTSKPQPDIFLSACRRAKVQVEQCSYIGDSLQDDALAAKAVGMKGIWLNREGLHCPQRAISVVKSLVAVTR